MKRYSFLLPLLLLIVLVFFLQGGLYLDPHRIPSPLIGKSVPAFSAQSIFDSKKTIDEKFFLHHVSVLHIFSTWCVSCSVEHPILVQLHRDDPSVKIIGVAFKDDKKAVLHYLNKSGNPYSDVIDDQNGEVGINFGVYGTPETFVIDQAGVIRGKIIGPVSPEILQHELLPLLKKLQAAK